MSTFIDLLGSMVIGGLLMLMAMTSLDAGVQHFVNFNADAIVQNELASLSEIMQNDLRKMGYNVPEAQQDQIIQVADSTRLRFLTHLNTDANPDTIEYQVQVYDTLDFVDTSLVLYAVNRRVQLAGSGATVTQVGTIANHAVFRYLNQSGQEVTYIPATKMVEVTMIAFKPDVYINDEYLMAQNAEERMEALRELMKESYWRQTRVISKNLRR